MKQSQQLNVSRRKFLRWSGAGAAIVATGGLGGLLSACAPNSSTPTTAFATATPTAANAVTPPTATFSPSGAPVDVELALKAAPGKAAIFNGKETSVWSYRGEVLSGDPNSLYHIPDSYLGPVIRVKRGQKIRINYSNEIPQPSIVHWHGLHVPDVVDGHPRFMMDQMMGFLGNRLLVNGKPDYELSVENRAYRLRLLNGSNSRIYKLGWQDGTPLTVIATDGGLLEKPVQRNYVTLGPAERVELWVDFSQWKLGSELTLQSLAFFGALPMDEMGTGGVSVPNGAPFNVLSVRVEREAREKPALPAQLSTIPRYQLSEAVNANNPRTFTLEMQQMTWTLNGRTFEMTNVANDEIVKLNTLEAWEIGKTNGRFG